MTSGGAAGLGDLLSSGQAAARRIANYATYYQMKSRAGTVGGKGVAEMLQRVRKAKDGIRIHLVGHSFGGRLVTATAQALSANTRAVSMSLLQAAFSHNGLSGGFGDDGKEKGFFRAVIDEKRISGPIIITHTKNDRAVGIAYPLASRIAGQNAAALGDQNDPYGGMGRNGAQNTREADSLATMGLPGTKYSFKPGQVHNVLSDVITGHSDVTRIEVAYAVLSAAGAVD
jgi:esterase/lipase superfamily enzyme